MKVKAAFTIIPLVAALSLLVMATFSWYTINIESTVTGIRLSIEASGNLEIAAGEWANGAPTAPSKEAGEHQTTTGENGEYLYRNESYWGGKLAVLKGAAVDFPAYLSDDVLTTISFDETCRIVTKDATDGRLQDAADTSGMALALTAPESATSESLTASAIVSGDRTAIVRTGGTSGETSKRIAASYLVWLRSNTNLSGAEGVYALMDASGVTVSIADQSGTSDELPRPNGVAAGDGVKAKDVVRMIVEPIPEDAIDREAGIPIIDLDQLNRLVKSGGVTAVTAFDDEAEAEAATENKIELEAGKATPVLVTVYFDGSGVSDKSVATGVSFTLSGLKLTFGSTEMTSAKQTP